MAIDNRLYIEEQDVDDFIVQMEYWLKFFQDDESKKLTLDIFLRIEEDIVENLFSLIRLQESKDQKETFDIAKARRLLEKNIDSIYNIQDLVEELNISIRTLQYNFKGKLGISPKHYLQNLRLNAIRKELLQQNVDEVNISNIALKYGFFHPSHFTLEYKKLFGETPTQTLTKDINTPKPHTFKLLI
jgi:AraC family ethanolamine operon transcriptional activator